MKYSENQQFLDDEHFQAKFMLISASNASPYTYFLLQRQSVTSY